MTQKNETPLLILTLLLTFGILAGGLWFLKKQFFSNSTSPNSTQSPTAPLFSTSLGLSQGETLLFTNDINPQKMAGIQAFSQNNYEPAIAYFQESLKFQKNDPETLIYLNNAQAEFHNPLKIAVVVPIGKNENIAKEILRGVAQTQNNINKNSGINGRYLQVTIANDNNDPQLASQVAQKLVQDSTILAVIGHNSSDATLGASPIYQQGGLVMISPTSNANKIASQGNYIFRTIPSVRFEANALSNYTINQVKKTKVGICFDSQAQYSVAFKEDFTTAIFTDGGQIIEVNCDLSSPNFNALNIINQAKKEGADSLLLIPSVDRLSVATRVAQGNQQELFLLGSSALYTIETLQQGKQFVEGMVIPVAWYPTAFTESSFSQDAIKLWGGNVNWRSALAYDAAQTLMTALPKNPTRQGIQKTLSNPDFRTEGATGTIRFLPSGDRNSKPLFVTIKAQAQSTSNTGFDFVLLK